MKKRVADIIMEILYENGITDAFSVVGGGAMHLNNAFARCEKIHKYYNHHEQACAMSAEAYVRTSGKLPVVCVTSGPGGTNTLTGVLCAWQDSLPMLIIAGQVRYDISVEKSGLPLRQRGEQEFEIIPAVRHMTKYAVKIINPLCIRRELQKAIDIATSGRRGPVWLDIPLDVQGAIIEEDEILPAIENIETLPSAGKEDFEFINKILSEAKHPCILVGSAVRVSNVVNEFRNYAEKLSIPVVAGIHVADALSFSSPFYYGMSGTIGPRVGNFILQNADVILVIGNSLHLTQTGFNQEMFAPRARIIMVDIDPNEAAKPGLNIYRFIHSDITKYFEESQKYAKKISVSKEWIQYCNDLKKRFPIIEVPQDLDMKGKIRQNYFWNIFDKKEPDDCIVAFGNSMGVAGVVQKGVAKPNQRLIANFWVGTMGNDLPEAFGAAIASQKEVICATGDGSIMMNLQELQTIKYYDAPVKIILFSNDGYGTIRNSCKNFFDGTKVGCDSETGVGMPDFEKVANAFGYTYKRCSSNEEVEKCIDWLFNADKHAFLEVMQDYDDAFEPKLQSRLLPDNTFATPALSGSNLDCSLGSKA
ncbi:MAG: thiamine pyrophosphate-binding protein, partial [Lachnospiraceae bacterium]|nr:thiamine pyrophosphate-binding protein [Lachnospiraceae bacterium]